MKKILLCIMCFSAVMALYSCRNQQLDSYKETRLALGTVIEITVVDDSKDHARAAIENAMAEINRIGSLFYEGNPESPLYKFSHRTGDQVEMPTEVLDLIQRGIDISELTDGNFDITVGILSPLWNFKTENPVIPSIDQINAVLPFVNYHELSIDREHNALISSSSKTMLTTGGIAKGYAVDRAIDILRKEKVKGALVNAGGDLRAIARADGKKWRVGIQNPRIREDLLCVIEIDSGAVVTSGDYQKFFFIDGKRYHHLLNPQTGFPADSCQSVTVIAPKTELADALATGIFIMGAQKGLALAERLSGIETMIVRSDGKISQSSGFPK